MCYRGGRSGILANALVYNGFDATSVGILAPKREEIEGHYGRIRELIDDSDIVLTADNYAKYFTKDKHRDASPH